MTACADTPNRSCARAWTAATRSWRWCQPEWNGSCGQPWTATATGCSGGSPFSPTAGWERQLRTRAPSSHISADGIDLMLVAITEVVTNALQHGQPPCRVRAWESDRVAHVRVEDHGHATGLATAGYQRPAKPKTSGTGLWLARQLADVIHTQTSASGTVVELQFR
jgi:anti-sigma regulatory factor (Ser/Thr protein kinase)